MRVVFCWWTFEGYFAACWKALARRDDIELSVLALEPDPQSLAPYDPQLLEGVDVRLLKQHEMTDGRFLLGALAETRADVIVVPGIVNRAALWAVRQNQLKSAAVVMAWDTPWRATLRQTLGRHVLGPRLRRDVDHVVVAGERAWQCVRQLGFDERAISRGMYGVDDDAENVSAEATDGKPKRGFLFVGRYVRGKGIAELADAYARYRSDVTDPWPLRTCGRGPLKPTLDRAAARDHGFVQPQALKSILRDAAVLVLPSRDSDPWPLAIVEGCAAGLPVICTEACGSSVELVRSFHNGLVIPSGDPAALARAMRWMHEHADQLPPMGRRSQELAAAYSAQAWARRWAAVIEGVAHD
jgi:glycosyltransferase involved in cell wall biosynthesis